MTGILPPFSGKPGMTANTLSVLRPLDPEKSQQFKETRQVLQQTLAAMKNSKNALGQEKKAMAAQKIARIKEALKNLKMMAFTDPKAMARMASRLARELASAIKDYASAGATYTEIQTASGTAETSPTAPDHMETETEVDADVQADVDADIPADKDAQKAVNTYDAIQKYGDDESDRRTSRKKDDDSDFIKEAREIMTELRDFIKSLRAKAGRKPLFARDAVSEAEKAIKEAEREFSALSRIR